MTGGKTTHEFSMNTVHPLDRDLRSMIDMFTDATSSLPIYSVWAFSDETSSLPTDSMRPLFWQIEILSGIYCIF